MLVSCVKNLLQDGQYYKPKHVRKVTYTDADQLDVQLVGNKFVLTSTLTFNIPREERQSDMN
jgi:hypothetical protein